MTKANSIKTKTSNEWELDEEGFWQTHLVVFVPVSSEFEDCSCLSMDDGLVGDRQAISSSIGLMLEPLHVQLAVAFQ